MSLDPSVIKEFESIPEPGPLLAALHKRFGERLAIGTSGQLTGTALIAMAVEAGARPRVFTVDTERLFPETYELFDKLEKRYGITIEHFKPDSGEIAKMVKEHGEFLFFDSKEKQEYCCELRKVRPNTRALNTLDVWVTGLRADQSRGRAGTARLQLIPHQQDGAERNILKVAPLVDWTEDRLREYLQKNDVPVHALLDKKLANGWRYESLGCVICTTPIGPTEPRRAGRWRWFNHPDDQKECGLHLPATKKDPA